MRHTVKQCQMLSLPFKLNVMLTNKKFYRRVLVFDNILLLIK